MNELALPRRSRWAWPRTRGARYLLAFWLTVAVLVAAFYAGLGVLRAVGRLPHPPVTATWCIDAKLAWLRANRHRFGAGVIAVGSSATWRNLDFSVVPPDERAALGGTLNAAPCFLRINQTRSWARFMLEFNPGARSVLTLLVPRDFEECSTVPADFFPKDIARNYLRGGSSWWIYFRNFRPRSFWRDVKHLPSRRHQLVFDAFGSGPYSTRKAEIWGPVAPEEACFKELRGMAEDMRAIGVRFAVVTFPVMPSWAAEHDPDGAVVSRFWENMRSALAGTGATLIEAGAHWSAPDSAFTDPVHLQWPQTASYTKHVWTALRRSGFFSTVDANAVPAPFSKHDQTIHR